MNSLIDDGAAPAARVSDNILFRLREMFGEDRAQIVAGEPFRVGTESQRIVAAPHTLDELSEMLQLAHAEGWRVLPAGAGTWLEMGNQPIGFELIVSTARMNRVLEYEPADLTASVQVGCTLADFNALAAEHRQFIPLDPFGDARSTIGGTMATASSGPLRCGYGTPRDWLIGITVVHADGTVSKAGGKVVKNVAGYDLGKLYTGSFGTLAVIAEMNFKLRALPPYEETILFSAPNHAALCALLAQINDSDLQPAAMELLAPNAVLSVEPNRFTLAIRFLHEAETVAAERTEVARLADSRLIRRVLRPGEADEFWRALRATELDPQQAFRLRLTGLPADLPKLITDVETLLPPVRWRAHAANGVLRLHAEEGWLDEIKGKVQPRKLAELRRAAEARGGALIIERAPSTLIEQLDVWGHPPATAELMRALKLRFDPKSLLNPGRFVAGI